MKYNVTLQVLVNIRLDNIEADSQVEAVKATDEIIGDSHQLDQAIKAHPPIQSSWAELAEDPPAYALVDEVGDEEYERSRWYFNHPGADWRAIDPLNNSLLEPASADAAAKLREALAKIAEEAEFAESDGAMDLGERLLTIARLASAGLTPPDTRGTILGMPIEPVDVDAAEGGDGA